MTKTNTQYNDHLAQQQLTCTCSRVWLTVTVWMCETEWSMSSRPSDYCCCILVLVTWHQSWYQDRRSTTVKPAPYIEPTASFISLVGALVYDVGYYVGSLEFEPWWSGSAYTRGSLYMSMSCSFFQWLLMSLIVVWFSSASTVEWFSGMTVSIMASTVLSAMLNLVHSLADMSVVLRIWFFVHQFYLTTLWKTCSVMNMQKSIWYFSQRTADARSTNEGEFHQSSIVRDPAARSSYMSCCYWK